jgi:hypothetical protein
MGYCCYIVSPKLKQCFEVPRGAGLSTEDYRDEQQKLLSLETIVDGAGLDVAEAKVSTLTLEELSELVTTYKTVTSLSTPLDAVGFFSRMREYDKKTYVITENDISVPRLRKEGYSFIRYDEAPSQE